MRLKIVILYLFYFFHSFISFAEDTRTTLVILANDGTKVAYSLYDKPKITFTKTEMVISTLSVEVRYKLENMSKFSYGGVELSSLTDIKTNNHPFKLDGESLLFPFLKSNSIVAIYNLNGNLIFNKITENEGQYTFPLSNLIKGVYIVKVNGINYKIIKR